MSQKTTIPIRSDYTMLQYLFYMFVGFCVWLMGVVIVRVIGATVFSADSVWLIVFFALSIPTAVVTMLFTQPICRLPMRDMMIPILVMLFTTLALDGLAVGFTPIYGTSTEVVRYAAGWLLWTFGTQILVSMWFVHRALKR